MNTEILPDESLKKELRSAAIHARNSLTEEERTLKSAEICRIISELPEYRSSTNIMIYKWTRGEVKLDELEEGGAFYDARKVFLYPLCIDTGKMLAIRPGTDEDAWAPGAFGIKEPVKEKGQVAAPEEIDLIICPLSGFDDNLNRLGMGGGYYDRFLPMCRNAIKTGVAFDVQQLLKVPAGPFDIKMDMIITESGIK